MSTVSVTNIKNASSSVNNAVTTSGGDLTNAAGVSFMGGSKNLLYNGACQIAQRNTSVASITTVGYKTADRWQIQAGDAVLGTWTQSVENDAPTGSGLRKSLKMLCTTANASPGASNSTYITQTLEGQDVQRVAKGTASAQQLTLSFWVKANVTGTYIAFLWDRDNSRTVSASYSVSASATWERKTITFPADATGAFDNDNAGSLEVNFMLGCGSAYTSGTLGTTWASLTYGNLAVGQTNLAAATNNYWQVTGVQLEVGPVATSFEFKSFGQELRECQRYFQAFNSATCNGNYFRFSLGECDSSTSGNFDFVLKQTMRFTPVVTTAAASQFGVYHAGSTTTATALALSGNGANETNASLYVNVASGLTAGRGAALIANNNKTAYVWFSAEL